MTKCNLCLCLTFLSSVFRTFLPSFLTLPFQKGKVRKTVTTFLPSFLTLPFWKGKVRKEGRKVRKDSNEGLGKEKLNKDTKQHSSFVFL